MEFSHWQCVDAGSEYCPCYLAETNDCIACSQLQGKTYCDCSWSGVCIYQEFNFLNSKRKDTRLPQEFPIVDVKVINDVIVLWIQVTKYMARLLKQPGSYIFIRNKYNDSFFDIPISIMNCDEDKSLIQIAVEVRGIKTKTILDVTDSIVIRGPYWNGIFGLNHLKSTKDSRCLVLARGIAQAPAMLAIKQLLKNNNDVDIIVNIRPTEHNFISKYFSKNFMSEVDMSSKEVANLCRQLMEESSYDLVFIGGADSLQNKVIKVIREMQKFSNVKFVTTNNNSICCGEGICGACMKKDEDGTWIKTCKAQRVNYK